ncbi:MAG: hypothetical protein WDO72_13745 [Pseudomonadota bacterium]
MKLRLARTLFSLLLFPLLVLAAADPAARTLKGRIVDQDDHPLPDVRVGLRSHGAVTQTSQSGEFTLVVRSDKPFTQDQAKPYDYVELDKDGYGGRAIEIRELTFFDKPLAEKLEPNPISEGRAEFSTRISMDNSLADLSTDKSFHLIPAREWQKFFASMESRKGDGRTEQVVFQAYIPKDAKKLKAVFLLTRHGMGSIDHPRLRAFANRNAVALVSAIGNPVQRGFYPVGLIDPYIARVGKMLEHPELPTLPVISFGHSNGTGFSGIIASQRPERTIAWISYHSGAAFHLQFPNIEQVPALVLHGLIDPFFKNGQEETVKHLRQERNAAMAMMLEANVAHDPVDKGQDATWDFIAAFSEAAMRIRLNDDGTLKPVFIENGWLGASYDRIQGGQQELAIAPYREFQGNRSTANWLPDKLFAETWQRYGKTDPRPKK